MKKSFIINDGTTDSINTCLINFKSKKYKNMLDNLIRPQFITEDNEFQEIIQYLICPGYQVNKIVLIVH